jgi:hypothetical protein
MAEDYMAVDKVAMDEMTRRKYCKKDTVDEVAVDELTRRNALCIR